MRLLLHREVRDELYNFLFFLVDVITPYMKKRNITTPIRVLSVKTVSIHNV